jgi:HK97 gp10 family phage protein
MAEFVPNPAFLVELEADPLFHAGMDEIGNEGLSELRRRIPVGETGDLEASAEVIRLPGGGQRLQVGTDHWEFPEFGTIYQDAQPYLRPTIDALGLHR